ncbi:MULTISPECIES: hypothetical protein [Bacillus]|uniref:hypothetical protein n=1 Tax=Bacillus TaxID=1386 RepID=UPI0002D94ED3|nr:MULTISPECIES: hypothetical protein [Bacillus]
MLMGYRGVSKRIYEWDWIPEEIISIRENNPQIYYPKYNVSTNVKDERLLEVPEKAFVYYKDIDFINRRSKIQISIFDSLNLKIEDLVEESIEYAFNTLQLNRIYGFIRP